MDDKVAVRPSVSFEVEKIIGMSIGSDNVRNYHVQWAPTWVSGLNLVGCEHLIQHFLQQKQNPKVIGEQVKQHQQPDQVQGLEHQQEQEKPMGSSCW